MDQNKAKKEGPGGGRGQTGSRSVAATRFTKYDNDFIAAQRYASAEYAVVVSVSVRLSQAGIISK